MQENSNIHFQNIFKYYIHTPKYNEYSANENMKLR